MRKNSHKFITGDVRRIPETLARADTFSICLAMLWNPPQGEPTGKNGHLYSWVSHSDTFRSLKAFVLQICCYHSRANLKYWLSSRCHPISVSFFTIKPCYLSEIQSLSDSNQRGNWPYAAAWAESLSPSFMLTLAQWRHNAITGLTAQLSWCSFAV